MKKILICILSFIVCILNIRAISSNIDVECPSSSNSFEEVSCKIYINASDFKLRAVQLKYTFSSGEYISFTSGGNFRTLSSNNNGAVLESSSPKIGKSEIGTLKFKMPISGNANFKLTDIMVTDDGNNSNIQSGTINDKNITVRQKSNINTLKSLKVKEGNYLDNFNSDNLEYNFNYNDSKITFAGSLTDSTSIVSGLKSYNLKYGKNVIKITVTSESGLKRVYTIIVNRTDTRDKTNTLDSITIDNYKLTPSFNKNTKKYTLKVNNEVSKVNISSELTSNKSSYVSGYGNRRVNLNYGKNTILIKVKSESNEENTYEIIINREDNRSKNNYLKSLIINNGEIKFDKNTFEYALAVKNEISSINVSGEVDDSKSTVTGFGNYALKEGVNTISINVTAENGSVKIYTLKVTRILKDNSIKPNNYLKSLSIQNYQIDFDKDNMSYNITIEDEKYLVFNYETESKDSSVIINGNEKLKNGSVISIIVTAIDGSTREYKFNISKIEDVKKNNTSNNYDKVQLSKTNIIKIAISCVSIVVSIIVIIIMVIVNVLKKKVMLWK